MRCERCGDDLGVRLVCPPCGSVQVAERIAYRDQVQVTLQGWRDASLVTAASHQTLVRRLDAERSALARLDRPATVSPVPARVPATAPTPPLEPRPEAPPPPTTPREPAGRRLPLPGSPSLGVGADPDGLGSWLRARVGWVTGVLLTVIGSIYLAGTLWSDLPPIWRQALVWTYLAASAVGFARAGRRLQDHPGGQTAARWLLGVSVALAPVHALAAGGLWQLGGATATVAAMSALGACTVLHHLLLRRSLPGLWPAVPPTFRLAWLGLALSVGLLPLASGPGWLVLPALGALATLWLGVTRARTAGGLPAVLVAECLLFHVLFTPPGPPAAYGPVLVLAALGCLYVDAARARWRGLHRTRPSGPLGIAALAAAGAALALLGTTLTPLPTTAASLASATLLTLFFAAATASWRRPIVWLGTLASALLVVLALPAQFALAVQWAAAQAGQALGYADEPLPLAWYSLTLLPYLAGVRWLEGWLARSGWRQSVGLARTTLAWGAGLSAALVLAAHSHPGDLRPALLALPLHGLLWTLGRPVRHRTWAVAAGLLGLVWGLDVAVWLGLSAPGVVALAGAAVCTAAWTARAWLPQGPRLETPLALAGLPTLLIGLGGLADHHHLAGGAWALGAGLLALAAITGVAATERWLSDRTGPARVLEVGAHGLAVLAVIAALDLDGAARTLAKIPVAIALVHWLVRHRHPVYGMALCLGLAELTVRHGLRLGFTDPGLLATLTAAVAWLPLAARAAGALDRPWLDRALAWPSAAVGGVAAAGALALLTAGGFTSLLHVGCVAGLAGVAWFGARRFERPALLDLARVLASWAVVAAGLWLGLSAEALGWCLAAGGCALALLPDERRWARLMTGLAAAALLTATATLPGAPGPSLALLGLAIGWLGAVVWQRPVLGWIGLLAGGLLAVLPVTPDSWALVATLPLAGVLVAMLTGARREQPLLPVLAVGTLAWLAASAVASGGVVLVSVVGLHALGVLLARMRHQHPVFTPRDPLLAVPLWTGALLSIPAFDHAATALALAAAVLVAATWGQRRALLSLWVPLATALTAEVTGLVDLDLLPHALGVVGLVLRPWLPWATVLCLLLSVPADMVADPYGYSVLVLLAPLAAAAWELRIGWREDRGWRWWPALAWTGWALVLARFHGPLQGLPDSWLLPVAVGVAVVLEGLRTAVAPIKSEVFVRPLTLTARVLPLAGLVLAIGTGHLTTWGLALVGCLSLLRYVFRPRTPDLLLGAVLVDAAALWAMAVAGVEDPVVWVAPVSLSLLIVARVLRDALGPQAVALMRYAAAGALYLAAFSDLVLTPGGSLIMLVLGLVGVAAGALFRVRAYLHLGAGIAAATLLADVLRFGLAHSQFWALYLTALGLAILGTMVAATLHRDRLLAFRGTLRTALSGWE